MEVEFKCFFCYSGFVEDMDFIVVVLGGLDEFDFVLDRVLFFWVFILFGIMGNFYRRRRFRRYFLDDMRRGVIILMIVQMGIYSVKERQNWIGSLILLFDDGEEVLLLFFNCCRVLEREWWLMQRFILGVLELVKGSVLFLLQQCKVFLILIRVKVTREFLAFLVIILLVLVWSCC